MTTFLDTNVLVYAQGDGPKAEIARKAILDGGTISVQVLNECASVLRRKFHLEWDAVEAVVEDVCTALGAVRSFDVSTHTEALDLARTHGLNFYDALILASALEAGCEVVLTEDLQAGRRIAGLTIVNPFA
ncbi:MAG: PIN domain-containing protein [Gammaproteobacteria bacterium]|nr:PIN domain-containing protein [Gammaproteobacteria bacterium]